MRVSAWFPHWEQERAAQSAVANADLLDEVMLFWEDLPVDPRVVQLVHDTGVRVVRTAFNGRPSDLDNLVDLVLADGYDGVDVDYEDLTAEDRTSFPSMLAEIAAPLQEHGKTLSVAVYAKTSEPGAWGGPQAHDYAAIGRVADRVRIMGYDFHWQTSAPGPIAPLPWLEEVVAFATTVVSPSKLELGVHLYGYDWVGTHGESITWDECQTRMQARDAERRWAPDADEPWFTYVSGDDVHTVWYADARSVAARLDLAETYGLGGVAFWCLGGEDPQVWAVVRDRRQAAADSAR